MWTNNCIHVLGDVMGMGTGLAGSGFAQISIFLI